MTKHTKGPWTYCTGDHGFDSPHVAVFYKENKIRIATCDMSTLRQAFAISGEDIASKEITEAGYDFSTNTEEANARRIAAAVNATEGIDILDLENGVVKELVETLKAITQRFIKLEERYANIYTNATGRLYDCQNGDVDRAKKAIQKAEGHAGRGHNDIG